MREPPKNLDAEKAVLGAVLIQPRAFADVASALTVEDFFLPAHREVFEAMRALDRRQLPIDVLSVEDELKSRTAIGGLPGGPIYLVEMAKNVPLAENIGYYTAIVRDKSVLRRLISVCSEATARAYQDQDSGEVVDTLSRDLAGLVVRSGNDLVRLGSVAGDLMAEFERRKRLGANAAITGVRTGLNKLDQLTLGFQPEQLVVVAADTSGGKTAFAMQSVFNHVFDQRGTSLVCNLEMSVRELGERAFAHIALVNSHRLKIGELDDAAFARLTLAGTKIVDANIFVEDQISSLREMVAKARAWRTRHPDTPGLLVVDFLQLVRSEAKKSDNRARELGLVAQELKALAKQLKIATILVSQINRNPATAHRAPNKHDIKESGDIENAADAILLIHNEQEIDNGPVSILVAKNRSGPSHRAVLAKWVARYYRFANPWEEFDDSDIVKEEDDGGQDAA